MERIPKGYQRVEVYEQADGEFAWRQQAANYAIIGDGTGFNTKTSAKRSAALATGVVFPPDLDYGYLAVTENDVQPNPAFPEREDYAPDPDAQVIPTPDVTPPSPGEVTPEPYQDRDY